MGQFLKEGGVLMWIGLVIGLIFIGLSLARRNQGGWRLALQGSVLNLTIGMTGVAFGFVNTFRAAAKVGDVPAEHARILAVGIAESINNIALGGLLALVLVAISIALAPPVAPSASPG